jgi:hypothetical protein
VVLTDQGAREKKEGQKHVGGERQEELGPPKPTARGFLQLHAEDNKTEEHWNIDAECHHCRQAVFRKGTSQVPPQGRQRRLHVKKILPNAPKEDIIDETEEKPQQ